MSGKPDVDVHEDEEVVGKAIDVRILKRLFAYARPYRRRFLGSIALLLLLSVTSLSVPVLMRHGIDRYLAPAAEGLDRDARVTGIFLVGGAVLLLELLATSLRYGQILLTNMTGQRVLFDLRDAVFSHISTRSLRFFDLNPVGRLVTRVTNDVETLNELFVSGIDVIFYDLLRIIVIVAILFAIDPSLAGVTLLVLPLIVAWSFFFKTKARDQFRAVRRKVTKLNSYTNESLTGIRVIQVFRRERQTTERFREINGELRQAHLATVRNYSFFFPGIELLGSLGTAVILLIGHRFLLGGTLTLGDMVAFWALLHLVFEPLQQLSEKYNVLQAAMASSERIFRVLDDKTAIAERDAGLRPERVTGAVAFEDVSFAYDGRNKVLKDVSFRVAPGERVALVGATGSGKTTITSLLARFYDLEEGRILLDGRDIRDLDLGWLRRKIGVVLQDVFLFSGTIRENLRLGDESIDDARIHAAIRTVHADRFLSRLPLGLDAPVEERGATFSLGEKQLLSFARALVFDPPILVLDEATASIDTETEALIQDALHRLMEGRTAIIIAHRLSTIREAHRILVVHHGQIREEGNHAELYRKGGIYRRLYELQYGTGNESERALSGKPT